MDKIIERVTVSFHDKKFTELSDVDIIDVSDVFITAFLSCFSLRTFQRTSVRKTPSTFTIILERCV